MVEKDHQRVVVEEYGVKIDITANIVECVTLDTMSDLLKQALLGLGYHIEGDIEIHVKKPE